MLEGKARLIDKEIPYTVSYVSEILDNGGDFKFPPIIPGQAYKVLKFDERTRTTWTCTYLPVFSGFDIETTNKKDGEFKRAYAYHMQMSVFTWQGGRVYLARTWEEVEKLFTAYRKFYNVTPEIRTVCLIANAGFEFQFMRRRFEWSKEPFDFFAKEKRQPLLFTLDGMEFRECLSISGGSLKQLCKDYTYTQKADGDLDYSIERNSETPLTETETGYCINDVVPLAEFSAYIFENFVKEGGQIPMTKTGILRAEVKKRAKEILKGRASDWRELLRSAYPDKNKYSVWMRLLFRGGYVHANVAYTGRKIENVDMFDITSSYPARMNLTLFPGQFKPLARQCWTEAMLDKMAEDETKSFIVQVTFKGLKARYTHSIESYSKVIKAENFELDNGRIRKGDITVLLTDYDWRIYRKFYTWEGSAIIESAEWAENMELPPYLLDVLNKAYKEKAQLKMKGLNNTPEYAIKKSTVNSGFGLTCTRIQLDQWHYAGDWYEEEAAHDFEDEASKAVLLPQWGIWIAASARWSLLSVVARIEETVGLDYESGAVIYNDTDSIKCIHDDRIKAIIDEYNAGIAKQLKAKGLTDPEFEDLGMYDFEGNARFFKTLGAKRYMCTTWNKKKDVWETAGTIAGLPKCVVREMDGDPYERFTVDGMLISADDSHKTTHAWIDYPTDDIVAGKPMHEESSVAIYEIPFSLKLDEDYYELAGEYMQRAGGIL